MPVYTPSILWSVVERHLDEAEFLFDQWQSAQKSPRYRFAALESGVEQRLLAHVDGLSVGGAEVADHLLFSALADPGEPSRVIVAALALLAAGESGLQTVLEALHIGDPALRSPLQRALILAESERIDDAIRHDFDQSSDDAWKAIDLDILTGRGANPGALLTPCLTAEHPALKRAALEAIRRFGRREFSAYVDAALRSGQNDVRRSALRAGLAFGSRRARDVCVEWAYGDGAADRELLTYVAMFTPSEHHTIFYRPLGARAAVEATLWALGFAGTVEAGDACLKFLHGADARAAKLAADSLSWIGGFDTGADAYRIAAQELSEEETLPPFEADDLDADLVPDGVDEAPLPHREAITQWWTAHRAELAQETRHVMGRPFSREALAQALEQAPLWRRSAVAFEAAARTGGALQVSTDSFSTRQRREMAR